MQEQFAGESIEKTAVGRTIGVNGTMTIAGGQVTAVTIEADLTRLKSDQGRRDDYIRTRGLETNTYGTATFVLAEPIALPADLAAGQPSTSPRWATSPSTGSPGGSSSRCRPSGTAR